MYKFECFVKKISRNELKKIPIYEVKKHKYVQKFSLIYKKNILLCSKNCGMIRRICFNNYRKISKFFWIYPENSLPALTLILRTFSDYIRKFILLFFWEIFRLHMSYIFNYTLGKFLNFRVISWQTFFRKISDFLSCSSTVESRLSEPIETSPRSD